MVKVWKIDEVSQNKFVNNETIPLTDAEKQETLTRWNSYEAGSPTRKLSEIRSLRNYKLQQTDYFSLNDMTLTDEMKSYRKGLRDIPQNNTTEEQYDLLLARDEQGNLTNAIWSKP